MSAELRIVTQRSAIPGNFSASVRSQIETLSEEAQADIGRASVQAMKSVVKQYVAVLRADVVAGGFYNATKLSRTWQGRTYPRSKPSMEPAGYIINKAATIIDAFEDGITITASGHKLLAIPQGPAKAIIRRLNQASNRSRDSNSRFVDESGTVQRVADALGIRKLVMRFNTQTGHGVLIAPGVRLTGTGRAARGRAAQGDDTVLFILARQATLKRRIQGRKLLPQFTARFQADFEAALVVELAPFTDL